MDNLGKMKTDLLVRLRHTESQLMEIAEQVGVNNRLEIYDEELIDRYVTLKQQMKYLTHNFLH
jgi:hypothetical protein